MLCLSAFQQRAPCLHQSGCSRRPASPQCFLHELLCVVSAHWNLAPRLTHTFRPPFSPTHSLCIPLAVIPVLGLDIETKPGFLQRIASFPSAEIQVPRPLPGESTLSRHSPPHHHRVTSRKQPCDSTAWEPSPASVTFSIMSMRYPNLAVSRHHHTHPRLSLLRSHMVPAPVLPLLFHRLSPCLLHFVPINSNVISTEKSFRTLLPSLTLYPYPPPSQCQVLHP